MQHIPDIKTTLAGIVVAAIGIAINYGYLDEKTGQMAIYLIIGYGLHSAKDRQTEPAPPAPTEQSAAYKGLVRELKKIAAAQQSTPTKKTKQ